MTARIVVCCGSGGVGKTTTSAALSLQLALRGLRVAVLTIDPARRLADSLGVGPIGNAPQVVPLDIADPQEGALLEAMMLDLKATFDDVVRRYSADADAAERVLSNRYYRFASTRLAGSHEYMAMEKLHELWEGDRYDVIVLDTPPTRHALEFLSAPDRMSRLMDEGVLHWLSLPRTSRGMRALERGSEVVVKVLDRLLGGQTIQEIAEFFHAFRELWDGFRARSLEVRALLAGDHASFLLVTTPAPAARREAMDFVKLLREREMPFGGFLVNRVVPPPKDPAPLPRSVFPDRPDDVPAEIWEDVLMGVSAAPARQAQLADAERAYLVALEVEADGAPLHLLPELDTDINSLEDLLRLGEHMGSAVDRILAEEG